MDTDYIINECTIAIIPVKNNLTQIIEIDNNFFVNSSSIDIIKKSCNYFGSSLKGRQEGSKYLLACDYKLPIIIDETRKIIFMPSMSSQEKNCVWLSYNNMETYIKNDYYCNVVFIHNIILPLQISYGSFQNQYVRAARLFKIINRTVVN